MRKRHTAQSAFLNLCLLPGVFVFFVATLLAVFATSAPRSTRRGEVNRQGSSDTTAGVRGREIRVGQAEGGPCQYTITFGSQTIVPGTTNTGNNCTWCDTMLNLPFPFVLYDQTFNAVMVNSSGAARFCL
jgi:hypothetical protein